MHPHSHHLSTYAEESFLGTPIFRSVRPGTQSHTVARPLNGHGHAAAQRVAAPLLHEPGPLVLDGARLTNYIQCRWFQGGRLCGAVMGDSANVFITHMKIAHEVGLEAETNHKEEVPCSTRATGLVQSREEVDWTKGEMNLSATEGFYTRPSQCSTSPDVGDEGAYADDLAQHDQGWNLWEDTAKPDSDHVNEIEFACEWVEGGTSCADRVKVKDLAVHLQLKHRITVKPGTQRYMCRWSKCSRRWPMSRPSLTRHVKEKHLLLKFDCTVCDKSFTREYNLREHSKRHCQPCASEVEPQMLVAEQASGTVTVPVPVWSAPSIFTQPFAFPPAPILDGSL